MMTRRPKQIVPFFKLRHQVNDTHEALSHELLLVLQVFSMLRSRESGLSAAMKASIEEREVALRKLVLSEGE